MNTEEINALIKEYEVKLEKLQPTLRATGDINFAKIGLLNSARHKEKLYRQNITLLRILHNDPEAVPEEILKAALSGVKPPSPMPRPAGTPFEQEGLWEPPINTDTLRVIKTLQQTYTPKPKTEEPPVMAYIPPKEQMAFVDGIQQGYEHIPDSMQFTDPETGSTHLGHTETELKDKIKTSRKKFKDAVIKEGLPAKYVEPREETVEETVRRVYGK
jgi:hypothetical protein